MKSKKGLIITVSLLLFLMALWIVLAILVIGEDDMSKFKTREWLLFSAFIAAEIATVVPLFIAADKLGKLNKGEVTLPLPMRTRKKRTPQERALRTRGMLILLAAFVIALLLLAAGAQLRGKLDFIPRGLWIFILCLAAAIPLLVAVCGALSQRAFVKQLNGMRVEEVQRMGLERREKAREAALESEKKLASIRQDAAVTAIMLVFSGALVAFSCGVLMPKTTWLILLMLLAVFHIAAGLSRIRFRVPTAFVDEDDSSAKKEEFPAIYEIAGAAAEEICGRNDLDIRISLMPNWYIGITELGGVIVLYLGVLLLKRLSEDELHSILRHEFSHITSGRGNKTLDYAKWQTGGKPRWPGSGLADALFFTYHDSRAFLETELYRFGLSVCEEASADEALRMEGGAEAAASALIKGYFWERFDFETGTYDVPPRSESETQPDILSDMDAEFSERLELRRDEWLSLIPLEILARNASHPTMKMRLDALGVSEYKLLPDDEGGEDYLGEKRRAFERTAELARKNCEAEYGNLREMNYLKPKAEIKEWEAEGRPLRAEEYSDKVAALRALGRNTEAEALCDRAIAELEPAAAAFGLFWKGSALVHRYDKAGIDMIYRAVELNNNYMDEGLDFIGSLCCLLGDEEGLETYRARAVELAQKDKDVYSKIGYIARGDKLTPEQLPEGELEKALRYFLSVDDGKIEEIYLVRKVITEEFFTSFFVIRFDKNTRNDERYRTMHRIFEYLDTVSDWQYSLAEYKEVPRGMLRAMPGSLVYRREAGEGENRGA